LPGSNSRFINRNGHEGDLTQPDIEVGHSSAKNSKSGNRNSMRNSTYHSLLKYSVWELQVLVCCAQPRNIARDVRELIRYANEIAV
jgi:hypothetical protein